MTRKRLDSAAEKPTVPAPHVIDPRGVYRLAAAAQALALPKGCLPREVRLGRLKVSKRGGRYFVVGQWLLDWLEAGVVIRRQPATVNGQTGS